MWWCLEMGPWGVIRSWRWSLHKWGQCPYKKRQRDDRSIDLSLSPHRVRMQLEGTHLHARMRALTRHPICWDLDLELPSFQNREKSMLFKPPRLWCPSWQPDLRQHGLRKGRGYKSNCLMTGIIQCVYDVYMLLPRKGSKIFHKVHSDHLWATSLG